MGGLRNFTGGKIALVHLRGNGEPFLRGLVHMGRQRQPLSTSESWESSAGSFFASPSRCRCAWLVQKRYFAEEGADQ
jgi:hypothetical protein